ncbi:beta-glucuronosyltransferase GlcAT14A-like [Chenopodium quinoa]|uniref:beta-glucuronosyltransferase GlcAT14A-like n=1 Tax=Chenopodium quinoa TaxID=63459 RepID=UPI000B76E951|nr:beta-glucuronosyltransferase GlcAT14A-like [Chenopodium quinoa]
MGAAERKKWLFALFSALLVSLLLFLTAISGLNASYAFTSWSNKPTAILNRGPQFPPSFAYYIYGGAGDKGQILRLLLAVYHPRNWYLLHLSAEASAEEREWLVAAVRSVPAIQAFENVEVIGKPIWLTYMGATNIAATLRAAAVLLKLDDGWDWFITLSASDYPLLTQDDLAHVFSSTRRDLNFIDHTSELGWKEQQRIQPIIVDPSIYLARRSQIFTATQKRPTPAAFKVFTGSPWVMLSRSFLEFCLFGWDNLPRTILMYFNNAVLPEEGYFHSVICNSPEFRNTTVNNDLRYMIWDSPPKMAPHFLNVSDFDQMIQSGAAFARRFQKDDPVLTMIDENILHRRHNRVAPGSWCSGRDSWFTDACAQWGDINSLKPGLQAKRFADSMTNYIDDLNSQSTQCK